MMPLTFADLNKEMIIKKIGGNAEVKAHLADLGFVVGGAITIVSSLGFHRRSYGNENICIINNT